MKFQLPADLSYAAISELPLMIPNSGKSMAFDVANVDDSEISTMLLGEAERAPARVVIRVAGGCKGPIKAKMPVLFGYFAKGCVFEANGVQHVFQGYCFSGGTDTNAVTNVPAYLARIFNCISGSTTPRTARMGIDTGVTGGVTVDSYGTGLDTKQHAAMVVQEDVKEVLSWSGDLRVYISFMKSCMRHGFKCAVTICNGGDVTLDEALLALLNGIPIIIIQGTERSADRLATAHLEGKWKELFEESFNTEGRELNVELGKRDYVDQINFSDLVRIAKFDENLEDLGASTFAKAHYELGLLTPVS